jgi:hypothetical protein
MEKYVNYYVVHSNKYTFVSVWKIIYVHEDSSVNHGVVNHQNGFFIIIKTLVYLNSRL